MLLFPSISPKNALMALIFNSQLRQFIALVTAFISLEAHAVGLGDITMHSRIGEPLRAEVPVFTEEGQQLNSACFSLAPLRGSDLPVITSARTRLARVGNNYRLIITGNPAIVEPVFVIGLRVSCGFDLQRDYILMPAPPLGASDYSQLPANATVHSPKRAKTGNAADFPTTALPAQEGDTLESIAEAKANGRISQQRRMLAALKRANPSLDPEQYLPEGTLVNIPNVSRQVPAEATANNPLAESIPPVADTPPAQPPRPKKKPRANPLAGLGPSGSDRIVLGGEPEMQKPGELAIAPHNGLIQLEERMLKMETTLRTLNLQVDNLNAAIEVTAETNALRQKLLAAQSRMPTPAVSLPAAVTPPPPTQHNSLPSWLELGLSALAGGLIATGLAYLLSRPQYQPFGKPRRKTGPINWRALWQKIRGVRIKRGWRRQ